MTAADAAGQERLPALSAGDLIDVPLDDPELAGLRSLCEAAATLVGATTVAVLLTDGQRQREVARYAAAAGDGSPCRPNEAHELRLGLLTAAGTPIGTLCLGTAPEASEQQLRAVRVLARQAVVVLELRLRSRQLAGSQARLAAAQDRLGSLAGQLAHDLKAPLTAILGFAELLNELDAVVADPRALAYVGRCTSAAQRMLAMIDELLADGT